MCFLCVFNSWILFRYYLDVLPTPISAINSNKGRPRSGFPICQLGHVDKFSKTNDNEQDIQKSRLYCVLINSFPPNSFSPQVIPFLQLQYDIFNGTLNRPYLRKASVAVHSLYPFMINKSRHLGSLPCRGVLVDKI